MNHVEMDVDLPKDAECPVCLQLLYDPMRLDCQHGVCALCWDKLVAVALAEGRKANCPVCRAAASGASRDTARSEEIRERFAGEWLRRHEAALAEARNATRVATAEEREAAEAEAEIVEADERVLPDGRRSRRMTSGLLKRCAREQCAYRTLALLSKLELSLCSLRCLCPALSDYSLLTVLHLEHNVIESLDGLQVDR